MRSNASASYKVLRTLLSQFCYERKLFPVECFCREKFGNHSVHVMKQQFPNHCSSARYLESLLEFGVQECLRCDCLIAFYFDVVDLSDQKIIETFKFSRSSFYQSSTLQDLDQLLRELTAKNELLLQTLDPIGVTTCFSVRLEFEEALTPFPSWIPPFFKKHVVNSASRQEREGFVELEIGCCALEMEQYRFQVESSRDGAANLHCSLKAEQIQHSMMATNTFVSSPVKSMMHQSPEPIRNRVGESAAFILSRRTYRNVNENAFGKRSWCTTKTINCGRQINDGT